MYRVLLTKKQCFLMASVIRDIYYLRKSSYDLVCLCGDGYDEIKKKKKHHLKELLKLLEAVGGASCVKDC